MIEKGKELSKRINSWEENSDTGKAKNISRCY